MDRIRHGQHLEEIADNIRRRVLDHVATYRIAHPDDRIGLIMDLVDIPSRTRARIQFWVQGYDTLNGAGSGVAFSNACLALVGSSETVASIDAALSAMEAQAIAVRDNVLNNGWTGDQVATYIEQNLIPPVVAPELDALDGPMPPNYTTIWGDRYP